MSTALKVLTVILFTFAMCHPVRAEPCRVGEDRKMVICEREGFDRAVKKCSDGLSDSASCHVKLDAAMKAWNDTNVLYEKCRADSVPPSPKKPILGYLTGLAGLGVIVIAPTLDSGNTVKWGVGIGGAIMVASGLWAVLP